MRMNFWEGDEPLGQSAEGAAHTRLDSMANASASKASKRIRGNESARAIGVGYAPATFIPDLVKDDEDFQREVSRVSKVFNIAEDDLYRVIYVETDGSMRADQRNKRKGSATGLIQFLTSRGSWARSKGLTRERLEQMSRAEQMKYVERFLKDNGLGEVRQPSFDDVYLTVFNPSLVGKGDDFVHGRKGHDYYERNKVWDLDEDKVIYRHEITDGARGRVIPGYGTYKPPRSAPVRSRVPLRQVPPKPGRVFSKPVIPAPQTVSPPRTRQQMRRDILDGRAGTFGVPVAPAYSIGEWLGSRLQDWWRDR